MKAMLILSFCVWSDGVWGFGGRHGHKLAWFLLQSEKSMTCKPFSLANSAPSGTGARHRHPPDGALTPWLQASVWSQWSVIYEDSKELKESEETCWPQGFQLGPVCDFSRWFSRHLVLWSYWCFCMLKTCHLHLLSLNYEECAEGQTKYYPNFSSF